MDLVAHSLRDHVNYRGSMISPMLVILSANSEAFVKDSRAADDIRAELDEKCLEEFPSARLAIVPYCTVKQNVTDKKLPAHEAAAGKQPKIRRISDKAAGSSALAACNAWVAMEKRAKLELCRLDDILDNIAAMCVMCVAWNRAEIRAGRPDIFGVYLTAGDVNRAYCNLHSYPLDSWKSGLYFAELTQGAGRLRWLLDLVLDFGGAANGANFCDVASGATVGWVSLIRQAFLDAGIDINAPAEVAAEMTQVRARGFIRSCRLRHSELRAFNDIAEQMVEVDEMVVDTPSTSLAAPPAVSPAEAAASAATTAAAAAVAATTTASSAAKAAAPEPWIYSTTQDRGVRAAAISHAEDYNTARECFRVHTYMDDFGAVHVDTPDLQRVKLARDTLAAIGTEMNLPFGKEKWEEGEASQEQIALGIGFNTSGPENPTCFVPDTSRLDTVFTMKSLAALKAGSRMPTALLQSLASKLLRHTMVVDVGRLCVCGLFANIKLQANNSPCWRLRHQSAGKRKLGGARSHSQDAHVIAEDTVGLTYWSLRNIGWWLKYYANGSPRVRCIMPKVTYQGDLEADACGLGYGGSFTAGTVMYYFFGIWSVLELISFDSDEPNTLNINALEMDTQHFAVYLGTLPALGAPLADQVIMPKCGNETTVVPKESYRARNEHMASLLEDYDHATALHSVSVQMTHLAGVLNRVSDILSRERASAAFFARTRIDFPHITSFHCRTSHTCCRTTFVRSPSCSKSHAPVRPPPHHDVCGRKHRRQLRFWLADLQDILRFCSPSPRQPTPARRHLDPVRGPHQGWPDRRERAHRFRRLVGRHAQ
jgi:hypothetical protein